MTVAMLDVFDDKYFSLGEWMNMKILWDQKPEA